MFFEKPVWQDFRRMISTIEVLTLLEALIDCWRCWSPWRMRIAILGGGFKCVFQHSPQNWERVPFWLNFVYVLLFFFLWEHQHLSYFWVGDLPCSDWNPGVKLTSSLRSNRSGTMWRAPKAFFCSSKLGAIWSQSVQIIVGCGWKCSFSKEIHQHESS